MTRVILASAVILMSACIAPATDPATASAGAPAATAIALPQGGQHVGDLVYVADGDPGTDRVIAIAMPEGRIAYELDMPGVFADGSGVPTPHITLEFAFFSRTVVEEDLRTFRTSVERIELRTGERRSVDAGTVRFSGILAVGDHEAESMTEAEREAAIRTYANQVARSYGQVVAAPDASLVLLTRHATDELSRTRIDRYDGRSLTHLGTTSWPSDPPERLYAIDAERVLAVGSRRPDVYTALELWTILDRELRSLADRALSDRTGPVNCTPELRSLRDGRTWAALCSSTSTRTLQLIDRDKLTLAGSVELGGGQPNPWNVLAWKQAPDGTIVIVTGRPSIIRVDPVAQRVLDHRLISLGSSPPPRQDFIQNGLQPPVRFSADGQRFYGMYLGADLGGTWRAPISMVDVASGKVMATALDGPDVTAIHLSADGARLYAIQDGKVVTLDAGNLAVLATTATLVRTPGTLLAVVPRP